jgi:hypothetical protein
MTKFFVLHTYKKDPQGFWNLFSEQGPGLALKMMEGKTPARCLKSWSPISYGRADYVFCLWEAEKPEDVITTLGMTDALDFITVDAMKVDEFNWIELAEAAKEASKA